ncbi:MAG: peptidase S10 [Chthoniobacteraceae bacterium]
MFRLFVSLSIAVFVAATAIAQEKKSDQPEKKEGEPPKKDEKAEKKDDEKAPPPKESKGSVTLGGAKLDYVAKVGTMPVLKEDGTPRGDVFFVSYALAGADGKPLAEKDPAARPITFCFNGGPGSAAVWLHFGGLGPKRIVLPPDGLQPELRGTIADNPNSILDLTDLVFIDPIGTGVSRAAKGEKPEQFWGVDEDVESVGEFIRLFTTREQRWMSPKFLCGESYGGIRGSGLVDYLQEQHGMYVDGLIVLSGVLNFQTLSSAIGNDLPYVIFLPTMTAASHFHRKLPADLQKGDVDAAMKAAREFARNEYTVALMKGRDLTADERHSTAEKLARFTGLGADLIESADLRIDPGVFREHLLRKEGKILGRFDARVTSSDASQLRVTPEFDPSFTNVIGPFSAAVNSYIRQTLGYESDHPYRVLTGLNWNYRSFANRYVSMEDHLADAMKANPKLRVLILTGRCDLAVPGDSTLYSAAHLPIPEILRTNIIVQRYESGHMMYLNAPDAEKLRRDLVEFYGGKK